MTGAQTAMGGMLAAVAESGKEIENFPLPYQIACAVMAALFLWTFSIARDPRGWRRLYQARFTRKEDFSVNRNKKIDETIKKYGIGVSMIFLILAVSLFVLGITHRHRNTQSSLSREDRLRVQDTQRMLESAPKNATRRSTGG